MKKIISLIMVLVLCASFAGCGKGVVLDENEEIAGNGTAQVTKGGSVYEITDNTILADGEVLYTVDNIKEEVIFALGEYLYVNTTDGAMQYRIDGSKVSKFGAGEILQAKGRWIYYQSDKSQVRGMSLYKIDMKEGRELLLFEGTTVESYEMDNGVFVFVTDEGIEYVNEINNDEAFYLSDWSGEEETETETE